MVIDKSMIKRLETQTFPNGGDKYFDYEEEFDALCRAIEAAVLPEGWVAVPEQAVERINQWAEAYPLDIFPEPDFAKAREALATVGITLDAVSASNMRHVITQVRDLLAAAPKPAQAEKPEPVLDEPVKDEPVAWMVDTSYDRLIFQNAEQAEHFASKWDIAVVPLYTRPQPDLTAEVEFMQGKYEEMLEEWLPQKQRIAELESQDTEMCDVHAQLLVEHGKAKLHIAALEAAAREARDALQYKLHVVEAIAKLDAVLCDRSHRP